MKEFFNYIIIFEDIQSELLILYIDQNLVVYFHSFLHIKENNIYYATIKIRNNPSFQNHRSFYLIKKKNISI